MKKKVKMKVFCITCGELQFNKNGEIEHPKLDKIYAERLENSFCTNYTDYTEK